MINLSAPIRPGNSVGMQKQNLGIAANPTTLLTNIIAYYQLDNNAGALSLVDATGNGYTLTNVNSVAVSTATVKLGTGCANFASGPKRLVATLPASLTAFSISLWAKGSTQTASYPELTTNNATNGIEFNFSHSSATTKFRAVVNNVAVASTTTVTDNNWHHGVMTWDGATLKLYTDAGTPVTAAVTSAAQNFNGISLGDSTDSNTALQYVGLLDEVGYWSRALTASEVTSLYNAGAGLPFSSFASTP